MENDQLCMVCWQYKIFDHRMCTWGIHLEHSDTRFPYCEPALPCIFRMESRYLLILTDSLSILNIVLEEFHQNQLHPEVVFGSRFKDDLSYTQVNTTCLFFYKTCKSLVNWCELSSYAINLCMKNARRVVEYFLLG